MSADDRSVITHLQRFVQPRDPLATVGGYHWGATANLSSILRLGLLSHNQVTSLEVPHLDLSHNEVQDRRSRITLYRDGPPLHDYANLSWHPRNPALLKVVKRPNSDPNGLVVTEFDAEVLKHPSTRAVAQHAASGVLPYRDSNQGQVWWARQHHVEIIQQSYPGWDLNSWLGGGVDLWGEPTADDVPNKFKMNLLQAEVLVPHHIPSQYIQRFFVRSEVAAQQVLSQLAHAAEAGWEPRTIPIVVCGHLFFETW